MLGNELVQVDRDSATASSEARHALSAAAAGLANWGTRERTDLSYTVLP